MQKLTLHIKKMDMTIIKNETKHIHSISPEISSKNLLLSLQVPNKILTILIQPQNSSKKTQIDIQKLAVSSQNDLENYSSINPFKFIQEGIKLRASKMQSTGKTKKLVWGNDSATKMHAQNSLPQLIPQCSDSPFQPPKQLTPFNDNYQQNCVKKLEFSKDINKNQKQGMFGELQDQMDKDLLKQIGKKLVNQGKESFGKNIGSMSKSYQIPMQKRRSQPDCTLKEKNRLFESKNMSKEQLKLGETQQVVSKKYHSRQCSDHSQKNLESFFNMDVQKVKEKKKGISYKTDMTTFNTLSKSIQAVEAVRKTVKNKQNDSINQKALMLKKGIVNSKKAVPNCSFVGATMVKSIRVKTEAH